MSTRPRRRWLALAVVGLVPVLLLAGLIFDMLRSDARLPQFLGLIPPGVNYFSGTDRLADFALNAGRHARLVYRLAGMNPGGGPGRALAALRDRCLDTYTPEVIGATGLDGEQPAAVLYLSGSDLGLVLPVADHDKFERHLRARLGYRMSFSVAGDDLGLATIRITGRAPSGTKFCTKGWEYQVPEDGTVDFELGARSVVNLALRDLPATLDMRCQLVEAGSDAAQAAGEGCECAIGDYACDAPIEYPEGAGAPADDLHLRLLGEADDALFCYSRPSSDYAFIVIRPDDGSMCDNLSWSQELTAAKMAMHRKRFSDDDTFRAAMRVLTQGWSGTGGNVAGVLPAGHQNPATSTAIFTADLLPDTASVGALLGISPWAGSMFEHLIRPTDASATTVIDPGASLGFRAENPAAFLDYARTFLTSDYRSAVGQLDSSRGAIVDMVTKRLGVTTLAVDTRPDERGLLGEIITLQFEDGAEAARPFLSQLALRVYGSHRQAQLRAIGNEFEQLADEIPCDEDPARASETVDLFRAELEPIGRVVALLCPPVSLRADLVGFSGDSDEREDLEGRLESATDELVVERQAGACDVTPDEVWALAKEAGPSLEGDGPQISVACHWRMLLSQNSLAAKQSFELEAAVGQAGAVFVSPALTEADVDRIARRARDLEAEENKDADAARTTRPIDHDGLLRGDYRWVGWIAGDKLYLAARPNLMLALPTLEERRLLNKVEIKLDSAELDVQLASYPPELRNQIRAATGNVLDDYEAAAAWLRDDQFLSAVRLQIELEGVRGD